MPKKKDKGLNKLEERLTTKNEYDFLVLKALQEMQRLIKENTKRIEEDEKAMLNIEKAVKLSLDNIDIITKIVEGHEKAINKTINFLNEKIVKMDREK